MTLYNSSLITLLDAAQCKHEDRHSTASFQENGGAQRNNWLSFIRRKEELAYDLYCWIG